jgi:acetyltransferase-like isoleucine patch superfamily enzyme
MIKTMGTGHYIADCIDHKGELTIGHCSAVGYGDAPGRAVFGMDVKIGAFSIIERNVTVGDNCEIGNHCMVFSDARIGRRVKLLSGSRVYWDADVGDDAIINGYVSGNVIVENSVRFFGRIAHSHRDHTRDWETTIEPSPVFRAGCFIGLGALIVGAITIGENAYVAAGETVRSDVPPNTVFYKGSLHDKRFFRGLIV